ncbi:MAG: bifunctional folylpolyglutamate synthase/dihydrofolate synthase [Ruminococcaceae bacterium]|nr:bifunctional folylpolyglutamate synthase/dihydrofolate synthase [Oscillospiraceae bacterium]
MMTYEEALQYIHSVTWQGSRPGLERITELCRLLGDPQDSLKFIHIAGTNGKGSVSRMISSILEKSGYRVGLFTSPFVERFNERIMLDGHDIADEDLASATEYVKQFAETMTDLPTEFELITAIALVYYKRMNCDYVVLECGLGGRLDSTNVVNTTVLSVITGIALDHTELLGDTTEKIAAEKAGIIKAGVPVIFGEGDDSAEAVIRERAKMLGSDYRRTNFAAIDNISSDLESTSFTFGDRAVRINLHGLYQTRNTATVLTAVDVLRERGVNIPNSAINGGLDAARWSARFEILLRKPLVIYDGAHNIQGITGAVENIKHYLSPMTEDGRVVLLMGVMADKDHLGMIEMLAPLCDRVYTVTPPNSRSLDSTGVEREFESFGADATAYPVLEDGVRAAVEYAEKTGRPLVCLGSLYMYADVKYAVRKIDLIKQEA